MLEDVTDLARLQAGRELRQVAPFDVAALLADSVTACGRWPTRGTSS